MQDTNTPSEKTNIFNNANSQHTWSKQVEEERNSQPKTQQKPEEISTPKGMELHIKQYTSSKQHPTTSNNTKPLRHTKQDPNQPNQGIIHY
ncbi:11690_t:CDS:2 [Acaulospora colombiana]|uniref:11690_t:CDS:1 n=1 Tax=Acaulospora colombiana TaxID=27376 RepID=A0ACA9LCI6_9GLOM|nr:11690_t:CDS:2 [Acaulospora colombiana]